MEHTEHREDSPAREDQHEQHHTQDSAAQSELQASRRGFLKSVATVGAGLALAPAVSEAAKKAAPKRATKGGQIKGTTAPNKGLKANPAAKPPNPVKPQPVVKQPPKPEDIHIAMIGPGNQGRNLMVQCLRIPGVRFVAICDIWPFSQKYAQNALNAFKQKVNIYSDYQEMLDQEKDLDAVIIATPDWVHAEQTIACLKAGKHVYCEKEMSNTIEGARSMVEAQRQTGKLLQIGHQRRSNPRYWHGDRLIHKDKTLGRITHTYGQWNRASRLDLGWAKSVEMDKAMLEKYGYDTMERFRNWRWYKKFSGGPIADLGSHQIDIFNWFLRTPPTAVQAMGGADYYTDRDWYDNAMATYEYKTAWGPVRGYYQVINTSSYGGYYELFMGDHATLEISEDVSRGLIYPEPTVARKDWENEAKKVTSAQGAEAILLDIGGSLGAGGAKKGATKKMVAQSEKPPHMLHLENFFDSIRGKAKLTCPPEIGYETAVSVLRVNDAIANGGRIEFNKDEFEVKS